MESLNKAKYGMYKAATGIAAQMQGTLKESKFLEKGVLTPEEYVLAGDHLCNKCGTWQ
jgi:ubiquitin-like-conjugating enzyme ATG3|tara:strand:- start:1055 stop:1228 length:174 start_codon:yes stop_codon:yes gene_type:complete